MTDRRAVGAVMWMVNATGSSAVESTSIIATVFLKRQWRRRYAEVVRYRVEWGREYDHTLCRVMQADGSMGRGVQEES